jgi:hypothetical protein
MARIATSGGGGAGGAPSATVDYVYNEVTNVPNGVETTVASYTAAGVQTSYLQSIQMAGTNVSEFRIYINGAPMDKAYLSLTQYNAVRDYFTGNVSTPGFKLSTGDIIVVKALQTGRDSTGNYNATIQVINQ